MNNLSELFGQPTIQRWWLYNIVNMLNAMELNILKWQLLCCVTFTTIKKSINRAMPLLCSEASHDSPLS